jgi:hypothetical protein
MPGQYRSRELLASNKRWPPDRSGHCTAFATFAKAEDQIGAGAKAAVGDLMISHCGFAYRPTGFASMANTLPERISTWTETV